MAARVLDFDDAARRPAVLSQRHPEHDQHAETNRTTVRHILDSVQVLVLTKPWVLPAVAHLMRRMCDDT